MMLDLYKFIFLCYFIFPTHNLTSQIDTLKPSKEIQSLKTRNDHRRFWSKLEHLDQTYRGTNANSMNDINNLILASLYFNKFGYPDVSLAGEDSKIINFIWAHTVSNDAKALCFPIVWHAYRNNTIFEKDFRDYFFRIIYTNYYDDTLSLKYGKIDSLVKLLPVDTNSYINISKLKNILNAHLQFKKTKKKLISTWVTKKDTFKNYINNDTIVIVSPGYLVKLEELDGKRYFTPI